MLSVHGLNNVAEAVAEDVMKSVSGQWSVVRGQGSGVRSEGSGTARLRVTFTGSVPGSVAGLGGVADVPGWEDL
jgi:hypothetical protein